MSHHWIHGATGADRAAAVTALGLPVTGTVDAHARLRGPYTAAGELLRELVPVALAHRPELVAAHDIELLTAAPELRESVPASRETLTSLAIPAERTRNYARVRTLRLAHGIAEFLRDLLAVTGPRTVVFEHAEHADRTDAELLSVLLRRVDPALLRCVVCTGGEPDAGLAAALAAHAERHDAPAIPGAATLSAADYVTGDCVSEADTGYRALPPDERAALHDARADELAATGELSRKLGALPYHRCHGSDPAHAGADAVRFAVDHAFDHGLYDATVALGRLGLTAIGDDPAHPLWWLFVVRMATPLAVLGRTDEAHALYLRAQATSEDPTLHMQVAYSLAMLHTRLVKDGERDHDQAKALVRQAIVLTGLVFSEEERAFQSVFMRNGLALIEVHLGNLTEAERLVTDGIERLDAVLGPDEHLLHRSVLRHNRSQLHSALGRLDEALADVDAAIAVDPHHAEYHFERGNLLRKLGRDDEALAEYTQVMRLSPPFAEAYYNRGDLHVERGELDAALADFRYVLELDPDWLDARVNLAGVLVELGAADEARAEAERGLAADPGNAHLHCVLGRVHADAERPAQARAAFDAALAADPALIAALGGRAGAAYDLGDLPAAAADLTAAVDLAPDDAALRFNRALVWQELGRTAEAAAELATAHTLAPDDEDITAALTPA